jgi:hypothetical protein
MKRGGGGQQTTNHIMCATATFNNNASNWGGKGGGAAWASLYTYDLWCILLYIFFGVQFGQLKNDGSVFRSI